MSYQWISPAETGHGDTSVHIATWTLGVLGIIAAAIGGWIASGPSDGSLTLYDRTWSASGVAEFGAPTLLIAGGAGAAAAMLTSAVRDWQHYANRWLVAAEVTLSAIGLVAVVAGVLVLV